MPAISALISLCLFSAANASASPFVVAIRLAGIKFLPAFINGCILLFVFSAANSDVYIGSRTLFQLAVQGQAPKIFKRVDKRGIPIYALFTCGAFLALSYICVSSSALTIFRYFTSLVSRAMFPLLSIEYSSPRASTDLSVRRLDLDRPACLAHSIPQRHEVPEL